MPSNPDLASNSSSRRDPRPGPKGPRKVTGELRARVLALRAAWQSVGTLLLAKCARKARIHHVGSLTDDQGLAFTLGLTALPKATHLGTYSWRVRRESNHKLLSGLVAALRPLGLATGEDGFNCDFHAIRHHGQDAVLEKHYVPRRSQRTRAVLTFFAQDHASSEMVTWWMASIASWQPRPGRNHTTSARTVLLTPAPSRQQMSASADCVCDGLKAGPNKGYGFGSSGTPNRSVEEHRESIRAFLAMIDPNTGYIGDD